MDHRQQENWEQRTFEDGQLKLVGSEFPHTGARPAAPALHMGDLDEPDLNLDALFNTDSITEDTELPFLPELPTGPYFLGQRIGGPSPRIRVSDPGEVSLDFTDTTQTYHSGYEGVVHSYNQEHVQNFGHIAPPYDQRSQAISSESVTESSFRDESTVLSGDTLEHKSTRTSASIPRPDASHHTGYDHICPTCGKRHRRPSDLAKHVRKYTPKHERRVLCEFCEARFLYPKDLRRHYSKHSDVKQFKCNTCQREFTRPDNRDRHQKKCPRDPNANRANTRSSHTHSTSSSRPLLRPRTTSGQSQAWPPRSSFAAVIEERPGVPKRAELEMPMAGNLPTPSSENRRKQPARTTEDMSSAHGHFAPGYYAPDEQAPAYATGQVQFGFRSDQNDINNAEMQSQLMTPPQSAHRTSADLQSFHEHLDDRYTNPFEDQLSDLPETPTPMYWTHDGSN